MSYGCSGFQIFEITDGTTTVNLLEKRAGFFVTNWTQRVTDAKGGGTWADSPLADGRKLKVKKCENVQQTLEVQVRDWDSDALIRDTQNIRRLLEKAASYSSVNWQNEPVWIKRQGLREEKPTYALIEDYRAGADGYPFSNQDLFWNALGNAAIPDWVLVLEHEPFWRSVPPGQPCPDEKTETFEYCFPAYLEFNGTTSLVNCGSGATLDDIPDNAVAGRGQLTAQAWVRSRSTGEGGEGQIFNKRQGAGGWRLYVTNQGLAAQTDNVTQDAFSLSGSDEFDPTDNLWHHVLMTYSETGAGLPAARTIYESIDGVWVASYQLQQVSIGNYVSDAARDLVIGNRTAVDRTFDGDIMNAKVSDTILYSPADGNFTPEPRCQLPVIDADTMLQVIYEGAGATTYDRSGNDNDGTITDCEWECDCDSDEITVDVECNCIQLSALQEWDTNTIWEISTLLPVEYVPSLLQSTTNRIFAGEFDQIWYSDDDGGAWAISTLLPIFYVFDMIQTSTGRILATDNAEIWHTDNDGVAWAASTTAPTDIMFSLVQLASGRILGGGQGNIWVSDDDGDNWAVISTAPVDIVRALLQTTTGRVIAGDDDQIWYSDDDGNTWGVLSTDMRDSVRALLQSTTGRILTGGPDDVWYSDDDGNTWVNSVAPSGIASSIYSLLQTATGEIIAGNVQLVLRSYDDAISWEIDVMNALAVDNIWSLLQTNTGRVLAGDGSVVGPNGQILQYGPPNILDMGNDNTCLDSIFVANKHTYANLTHIFIYDGVAFSPNLLPLTTYTQLYPTIPALNDYIAFGIDTTILDIGPFDNLVFELLEAILYTNAYTITWEYISAAGPVWSTLNVSDGTNPGSGAFRTLGPCSVHWVPPSDWSIQALNGVTGYWVRARVSALAGAITSPVQAYRNIYTSNVPDVDVDEAQIFGDVTALARIEAHNRSDEDGYSTVDELDLMTNRLIVGLRSNMRDTLFTSFINLAEDGVVANTYAQNHFGITVTDGTGTTTTADIRAPAGIAGVHVTTGNGLTFYDNASRVTFGPSIARDFYGEFHFFVRAQLEEPATSPVGNYDSVRVRLKLQTGSGGVFELTDFDTFNCFDANGEHYKDFQLLDFGRHDLPVSGSFDSDELPDEFTITVQIASDTSTNLKVTLYDLVMIPVDEWSGDFFDIALENDSGVTNGYKLDIDSVTYPKKSLRSTVRTADASAFIKSVYDRAGLGPAVLQSNADQRLFFIAATAVIKGADTAGVGATTLSDTYVNFIEAGVKPGMIAYNVTTGQSATITAVNENTCTTTTIVGGWNAANVYFIVCPNWRSDPYIVHSIQVEHVARYLSMRGNR